MMQRASGTGTGTWDRDSGPGEPHVAGKLGHRALPTHARRKKRKKKKKKREKDLAGSGSAREQIGIKTKQGGGHGTMQRTRRGGGEKE